MNPETITSGIVVLNGGTSTNTVFMNPDYQSYSTTTGFVYNSPNNLNTVLDYKPLKHFLMKYFKWIVDVTEVSIRGGFNRLSTIDIHITVSPTHHTELMNDRINKIIQNNLEKKILSHLKPMYPEIKDERPNFIFFPEYSETILKLL